MHTFGYRNKESDLKSDTQMHTHISFTFSGCPCTCPTTVPCLVFFTQPVTQSFFASSSEYCGQTDDKWDACMTYQGFEVTFTCMHLQKQLALHSKDLISPCILNPALLQCKHLLKKHQISNWFQLLRLNLHLKDLVFVQDSLLLQQI